MKTRLKLKKLLLSKEINLKILIFGLPGSGKSTLAKPFADLLGGVHINADEVRTRYDDWDFTPEGRMRQAARMKHLSDGAVMAGKIAVADFVCPTEAARLEFDPDFSVCGSNPGPSAGSGTANTGGGGGGTGQGAGGGGAGGYRESFPNPATGGLPVSVQAYPITVGGGGGAVGGCGTSGSGGSGVVIIRYKYQN